MPEPEEFDTGVAAYVLGELDAQARADFEARLAASPDLRAAVQEFETACEALALASPQISPPRRLRQRLLRQATPLSTSPIPLPAWQAWIRWVWPRAVAGAAFLFLGWLAHDWASGSGRHVHGLADAQPTRSSAASARNAGSPGTRHPLPSRLNTTPGSNVGDNPAPGRTSPPVGNPPPIESARLRAWVQQLAGEVADLNQTLARQAVVPEGAARFQLFQLTGTNLPRTTPGLAGGGPMYFGQPGVLEQWLAGALARQLSSSETAAPAGGQATPSTETASASPTTDHESPPAERPSTNLLASAADAGSGYTVVDLSPDATTVDTVPLSESAVRTGATNAIVSLGTTTAGLGFYSPDTGRGSMALVIRQALPTDRSLQFWAIDNANGSTINLGTADTSGTVLFVRFTVDPKTVINPGFLVTLEPVGGSSAPTGPIVVQPPSSTQPEP